MDRTSGGLFYRIVDGNAPAVVRALGPNVLELFVLPCTGPQYRRSRLATTARPSRLLSFPRAFRFGLSGTHALEGKSRSPWITSPFATSNSKLPLSGGDLPDVLLYLPQRPLQNIIRKSGKHVRHDCATSHPKGRTQAVRVAENASSRLIGEPLRAGSVRCQVASFVVVSRAEFRTTRQCPGLLGFTPLPRRCRCLRR